jgi:NAD-dependent deacetylase
MLPQDVWLRAAQATASCKCFLVIGTSAVVYPAAGLVEMAQAVEASVIEINLERTPASYRADVSLFGKSGEVVPRLVELLGQGGAST